MKGILLTVGAGLLIIVPTAVGLVGNTSFAQSVPVRVPPQATLMDEDDHERGISTPSPTDDKGGQRGHGTPSPTDDRGGQPTSGNPGSGGGAVEDSSSGKGQNGGRGGNTSQSGGPDDGSGHT